METRIMRMTILAIAAALMLLFSTALAADEDEKKMENVVELETGIYYTVQEGDTLWDLSQRFSDSPWMWPDL